MGHGPLAIVAAMEDEVSALRSRMLLPKRGTKRPPLRSLTHGWLGERPVVLAVTGDGAPAMERGVRALLDEVRPSAVLLVGVSGALHPDLVPGAVAGANEVRREGESSLVPDRTMTEWLGRAQLRPARVLSVRQIVGSRAEKQALHRLHGSDHPTMVDLESFSAARALHRAGVPWAVVRAVSDAHDEEVPEFILDAQREDGSLRRELVAARALLAPRSLPLLWSIRTRVRQCAEVLASTAETLARAGLPRPARG